MRPCCCSEVGSGWFASAQGMIAPQGLRNVGKLISYFTNYTLYLFPTYLFYYISILVYHFYYLLH